MSCSYSDIEITKPECNAQDLSWVTPSYFKNLGFSDKQVAEIFQAIESGFTVTIAREHDFSPTDRRWHTTISISKDLKASV